jgi:hypothetical protein
MLASVSVYVMCEARSYYPIVAMCLQLSEQPDNSPHNVPERVATLLLQARAHLSQTSAQA